MAEFILMPKLGFNMETGQISKWHKCEGDVINKGDVIVDILTDKTNMEIESTCDGTLRKILINETETVPVILPIAIIGEPDENIDSLIKEAKSLLGQDEKIESAANVKTTKVDAEVVPINIPANIKMKLSPRATRYVNENQIDMAKLEIKGTGFEGGITAQDIDGYVKQNKLTPLAQKIAAANNIETSGIKGTGIGGKITKTDVQGMVSNSDNLSSAQVNKHGDKRAVEKIIDYTGMRKVIGTRLSQSKFSAPHVYFTTSIDVSNLMELRQQVNKTQQQKVSLNDFLVGAVTKALQQQPELNSSIQEEQIIQYADVNVGIAVGLETGLIVPVIKQAQNKKITQIARESQSLAEKARTGKLLPEEYQGGTFTISNLGMYGIENFTAIINPPEAAILSVSAVKKTPTVIEENGEEQIVIRPMMNVTLSVDHRIVDGLAATRFVNLVKQLVENPFEIIL